MSGAVASVVARSNTFVRVNSKGKLVAKPRYQAVSRHLTPLLHEGEPEPDDHLQLIRSKMTMKRICEVEKYNNRRWLNRTLVLTESHLFILWKRQSGHEIVESISVRDIYEAEEWPIATTKEGESQSTTGKRGKLAASKSFVPGVKEGTGPRHLHRQAAGSKANLFAQREAARHPPIPSPNLGDHFVFKVRPENVAETLRYFKFVRELPLADDSSRRKLSARPSSRNPDEFIGLRKRSTRNSDDFNINPSSGNADEFTTSLRVFLAHLNRRGDKARHRYEVKNRWKKRRRLFIKHVLDANWYNFMLFAFIVLNFVFTVLDLQNNDPEQDSFYNSIDLFFTVMFATELGINTVAYGKKNFRDNWFWFDILIVGTSVILLFADTGGGADSVVKQMRVLRAFRLLRIVGKVGNLRRIVNSLVNSLIPTLQAEMISLIVILIYSVIGLQYFGDREERSFGTFTRASLTLMGLVATITSWPSDTLPFMDEDYNFDYGVICFVFSFITIVLMILLQMVIAVLLDAFFAERAKESEEKFHSRKFEDPHGERALDPFLKLISSEFQTQAGLEELLRRRFREFDFNESGALSYTELCNAFSEYGVDLASHAIDHETEAALNSEDGLDCEHFQRWMSAELKAFMQRQASEAITEDTTYDIVAVLQGMRTLMIEQGDIRREQAAIRDGHDRIAATAELALQTVGRIVAAVAGPGRGGGAALPSAPPPKPAIGPPPISEGPRVVPATTSDASVPPRNVNEPRGGGRRSAGGGGGLLRRSGSSRAAALERDTARRANVQGGRSSDSEEDVLSLPEPVAVGWAGAQGQTAGSSSVVQGESNRVSHSVRPGVGGPDGGPVDAGPDQPGKQPELLGWAGHGIASNFVFVDEAVAMFTNMAKQTSSPGLSNGEALHRPSSVEAADLDVHASPVRAADPGRRLIAF